MSTVIAREKKVSYLRGVQAELKKVTWTSKKELVLSAKVVVLSIFVFGFSIYLVDLTIRPVIDFLGSLVRMLVG